MARILREGAILMKHELNSELMHNIEMNNRTYLLDEFYEFKRDLFEAGSKTGLLFMEYAMKPVQAAEFLKEGNEVLAFKKVDAQTIVPLVTQTLHGKKRHIIIDDSLMEPEVMPSPWLTNEEGEVILFVMFPYQRMVSEGEDADADLPGYKAGPVRRLLRLLSTEKKEITYILFYAVIIGAISLVLPLGIQTTVELVSGGVFFSSIYLLITLVIVGVLVAGGLQMMQITLVENVQRRIFTKAAFEFTFRIPRIKVESILKNYAPELVNRFFDVMTLQKGLPKLLIDLSSAVIQIFFGLLLLSLYHPFFVFFSLILVTVLVAIFYLTGPRGLDSSLKESKYKYKVVQWLEELARAIQSFKLAGNTDLPIRKTDQNVTNYIKYRKTHFSILLTQFSFIVVFKGLVTAGLLIMGTILVVDRQITLGQFVASEIIIILILNSVEKVIMYMDVVYDMLTAVDKISHVTDLPLDKLGGIDFPPRKRGNGFSVQVNNLRFTYPGDREPVLKGINLQIQSGERVCIAGPGGAGKTTLTNIISGLLTDFDGSVTINNYSVRDLDLIHLRNHIAKNISPEDLFDGTLLENVTLGKADRTVDDAMQAISKAGLTDRINELPEGLSTHIISGGKGFSSTMIHRLILARCLAKNPELIILNDFFNPLKKTDKVDLVQRLVNDNGYTLILVSNDPLVMAACDRVVVLYDGNIVADGKWEELLAKTEISKYLD